MFSTQFGWRPIDTAPMDKDVVTDGRGEPYAVHKPFGWVSSGKGTPLTVTPLQIRPSSEHKVSKISNARPSHDIAGRRFPPPSGRSRLKRQPFSRTGENPQSGMLGGSRKGAADKAAV